MIKPGYSWRSRSTFLWWPWKRSCWDGRIWSSLRTSFRDSRCWGRVTSMRWLLFSQIQDMSQTCNRLGQMSRNKEVISEDILAWQEKRWGTWKPWVVSSSRKGSEEGRRYDWDRRRRRLSWRSGLSCCSCWLFTWTNWKDTLQSSHCRGRLRPCPLYWPYRRSWTPLFSDCNETDSFQG